MAQPPCYFQISRQDSGLFVDTTGTPCRKCPLCLSGNTVSLAIAGSSTTQIQRMQLNIQCVLLVYVKIVYGGDTDQLGHLRCLSLPMERNASAAKDAQYSFWRCRERSVKKYRDLPTRLYYCYLCREEMYPPTPDSRPRHGRICHICEAARNIQRTKFGIERQRFCPRCDFSLNGLHTCSGCDAEKEI